MVEERQLEGNFIGSTTVGCRHAKLCFHYPSEFTTSYKCKRLPPQSTFDSPTQDNFLTWTSENQPIRVKLAQFYNVPLNQTTTNITEQCLCVEIKSIQFDRICSISICFTRCCPLDISELGCRNGSIWVQLFWEMRLHLYLKGLPVRVIYHI